MHLFVFFFKQKTAYEMRISDWSSDVCSSDLLTGREDADHHMAAVRRPEVVAERAEDVVAVTGPLVAVHLGFREVAQVSGGRQRHVQIGRASCRERVCQYV